MKFDYVFKLMGDLFVVGSIHPQWTSLHRCHEPQANPQIFHTNLYHTSDDLQKIVEHFQPCKRFSHWIGFKIVPYS